MKKMMLTAIFGASLVSASAQVIQKGRKILGGSLNIGLFGNVPDEDNSTINKQRQWTVGIAPSFGKSIKDNRVFGYRLFFTAAGNRSESPGPTISKNSMTGIAAGVFMERFIPIGRQFFFSLPISLDGYYRNAENKQTSTIINTVERKTAGISLSADPTLSYQLNKNWLLQIGTNDLAEVYFNRTSEKRTTNTLPVPTDKYSEYGFQSSLNNAYSLSSLSFSVRYIF